MSGTESGKRFSGSIPKLYEQYLVPLLFEPYAADLVDRLAARPDTRVLEIAAGTGVVTRRLASALPGSVSIVATDLNPPMLDLAASIGTARPVEWRQADALQLPFPDAAFDAVVCQFGVMFLPDKPRAFSEVRRVLRANGVFLFNVWDRLEDNEIADAVSRAISDFFPDDPPCLMARTGHGYFDPPTIARDLASGGFTAEPRLETLSARSQAENARIPAVGFCQGPPLRNEIEARGASRLEEATDFAEEAIAKRFGSGAVDGKMQAHVITIEG